MPEAQIEVVEHLLKEEQEGALIAWLEQSTELDREAVIRASRFCCRMVIAVSVYVPSKESCPT